MAGFMAMVYLRVAVKRETMTSRITSGKWPVLAIFWLIYLLNYADRQVLSSVLPLVKKEWMLSDTGFEVIDWVYTKPVVDINPPNNLKRRVKKMLRNLSFNINKNLSAKLWGSYSMMILAK